MSQLHLLKKQLFLTNSQSFRTTIQCYNSHIDHNVVLRGHKKIYLPNKITIIFIVMLNLSDSV